MQLVVCCAKALWCKNKEILLYSDNVPHIYLYMKCAMKNLGAKKKLYVTRKYKELLLWKSLSSLYFCIKILSKNSSFFLLYFNLFPSLFSLCIFRFSSLVHKTTRLKRILRWDTFSWLFLGVCVFSFFLSSSCPEPHSSEEKTAFEHKKRRPRVKINQRRIHFEKIIA